MLKPLKKLLACLFFLLLSVSLSSQYNYVVNGGFENYSECPTSYGTPGDEQVGHCVGWSVPTYGTSDYYNTCATPLSQVDVPYNVSGYQFPKNGEGYCGFFAYQYGLPVGWLLWHEYIQGTIYPPLENGKSYWVSFYVSLSEVSNFAASKIGAYISVDSVSRFDASPFNYAAQVVNPTNNFITDTSTWVNISGSYIATGGESFITLGWWGDSLEGDTLRLSYTVSLCESYYYIDEVSIVEDTTVSYLITPNVFTPNNDGINDNWYPDLQNIIDLELLIYNRWGELIYNGDENSCSWNGNCGDQTCSDGSYFYIIQAIGSDQKKYHKKGFIQLFR